MSKTLSTILTIFKVAKILARVVFILCLIGAGGCLLGLCVLPFVGSVIPADVLLDEGVNLSSSYLSCLTGLVGCAGRSVFAYLSERYFLNVLNDGTPFTFKGSNELFRLGVITIDVVRYSDSLSVSKKAKIGTIEKLQSS